MKAGRTEAAEPRLRRAGGRLAVCALLAALAAAGGAPMASGQAAGGRPPAAPAAPAAPEVDLFFGLDQATWLPRLTTGGVVPRVGKALEDRAAASAFRLRNQDVFGLRMYPREESPVVPREEQTPRVARTIERVTLNEALQTLTPNGVNLARREMLLGGRTARVGDALHLTYKGQTFLAEILEVGLTEIRFRDVKRRENGVLPHECVPLFAPEKLTRRRLDPERLPGKVSPMEPTR